jgi:predicted ribosomally synthesized peptide with nif11-like leader
MSEEHLKAFLEKIEGDNSLQKTLTPAKSPDEVSPIARDDDLEFRHCQLDKEQRKGTAGDFSFYAPDGFSTKGL